MRSCLFLHSVCAQRTLVRVCAGPSAASAYGAFLYIFGGLAEQPSQGCASSDLTQPYALASCLKFPMVLLLRATARRTTSGATFRATVFCSSADRQRSVSLRALKTRGSRCADLISALTGTLNDAGVYGPFLFLVAWQMARRPSFAVSTVASGTYRVTDFNGGSRIRMSSLFCPVSPS